jgi:hypothetical protein
MKLGAAPVTPLPRTREELALVVLQRLVALALAGLGVLAWMTILGMQGLGPISALTVEQRVYTVLLGTFGLVACVGLWMGATWGTTIWLVIAGGQGLAHTLFARAFGENWWLVGAHIAGIMLFVVLAWRIARARIE